MAYKMREQQRKPQTIIRAITFIADSTAKTKKSWRQVVQVTGFHLHSGPRVLSVTTKSRMSLLNFEQRLPLNPGRNFASPKPPN